MKKVALYLQSILYIIAGFNHFRKPDTYAAIVPHWIDWRMEAVYISGVAEIILGFLLLFKGSRKVAAWGIIILLIVVFPANIQMAIDYIRKDDPHAWITIARLPLQLLLIWLAWIFARDPSANKIKN